MVIACRDLKKAEVAASEIRRTAEGSVEVEKLDLSSFQSVRDFTSRIHKKYDKIDILINNAGELVFVPDEYPTCVEIFRCGIEFLKSLYSQLQE